MLPARLGRRATFEGLKRRKGAQVHFDANLAGGELGFVNPSASLTATTTTGRPFSSLGFANGYIVPPPSPSLTFLSIQTKASLPPLCLSPLLHDHHHDVDRDVTTAVSPLSHAAAVPPMPLLTLPGVASRQKLADELAHDGSEGGDEGTMDRGVREKKAPRLPGLRVRWKDENLTQVCEYEAEDSTERAIRKHASIAKQTADLNEGLMLKTLKRHASGHFDLAMEVQEEDPSWSDDMDLDTDMDMMDMSPCSPSTRHFSLSHSVSSSSFISVERFPSANDIFAIAMESNRGHAKPTC
ncbi:unnamed protein product [Vitrella brassicaformis CCMP3155]|uniref:Uncharacterized protein n=1 Tax=Vitrella brassicaformis (strain CCMP3155) TaxID=1169540 RepID=A0A0G4EKP9_VITBC|nr:unnamed protein product [Vitrella brassicaformis CCMP3155]|mmetsp:Transcript_11194/g.27110  ORF Transcript_11194/g.27110 Transcript_11194/m.27110 type:complete len:297 (-) Transcript_11194:134-1024(-)|eukprot:CEL97716.1 unnamed protein product [Vitrella brassicaformis CCMP3155]